MPKAEWGRSGVNRILTLIRLAARSNFVVGLLDADPTRTCTVFPELEKWSSNRE